MLITSNLVLAPPVTHNTTQIWSPNLFHCLPASTAQYLLKNWWEWFTKLIFHLQRITHTMLDVSTGYNSWYWPIHWHTQSLWLCKSSCTTIVTTDICYWVHQCQSGSTISIHLIINFNKNWSTMYVDQSLVSNATPQEPTCFQGLEFNAHFHYIMFNVLNGFRFLQLLH